MTVSDRTSAEIFGEVFAQLAKKDFNKVKFAEFMWNLTQNYDFSPYQMDVDDPLKELGLAWEDDQGDLQYGPKED